MIRVLVVFSNFFFFFFFSCLVVDSFADLIADATYRGYTVRNNKHVQSYSHMSMFVSGVNIFFGLEIFPKNVAHMLVYTNAPSPPGSSD